MKIYTRVAMILSISGVLVAGAGAAVVNAQVLRQDSGSSVTAPAAGAAPAAVPVTSASTSSTSPASSSSSSSSSVPGVSTGASGPTPSSSPAITVPGAPVPGSATQQQFRLGDAATAILDTAGGQLSIVTIAPHPGWTLVDAEQDGDRGDDGGTVEIELRSPAGEVRFEASLVRGVIVVSLRTEDDDDDDTTSTVPGTSTIPGTVTTRVTVDDHGGDDNSGPGGGDGADDNSGSGSSGSGSSGSGSGGDDD